MDHDKLVEVLQKLQDWLINHDPTDEKYKDVEELFIKLSKLEIEFDDACDRQLERQNKYELDRDRMNREFDLKEKEIDFKNGLEAMKVDEISAEATNRRRSEVRAAYWELIRMGFGAVLSAFLIAVTGRIEQHAILGQHQWSLIPKAKF